MRKRKILLSFLFLIIASYAIFGCSSKKEELWEEPGLTFQFHMVSAKVDYLFIAHGNPDGTCAYTADYAGKHVTGTLTKDQWVGFLTEFNAAWEQMNQSSGPLPAAYKPDTAFVVSLRSKMRRQENSTKNDPQAAALLIFLDKSIATDPYRDMTK
jgi:hypothetical protein